MLIWMSAPIGKDGPLDELRLGVDVRKSFSFTMSQ